MKEREHYPQRKVTLLPGDTIWATYKQNPNAPVRIAPATLKRLYGWTEGQRYIGKVREEPPTNSDPEGRVVVDFYDDKKGKFLFTHLWKTQGRMTPWAKVDLPPENILFLTP